MAERIAGSWIGIICMASLGLLHPVHAQHVAPAPARAVDAAAELRVINVNPNLNVISGAGANVLIWSGPDGVVLVDSGSSDSATLLAETVAEIAAAPVKFVVNTNGHGDHAGGNETFVRKGAIAIGNETLRARAGREQAAAPGGTAAMSSSATGRPALTTGDALALHLNGDRLDVIHVADAHTSGDLVVRWNDADVVALGDVYWNGQYPFIDVDAGGSMAGTVAAVEATLARANARTVIVPGHGAVSNRSELAAYRDMLVSVGRKVRQSVEQGIGLDEILAMQPTADFDSHYAHPGAAVTPDEFVRSVYRDLTSQRPGR